MSSKPSSKPAPKLIPTVDSKAETIKKKAATFQWEYSYQNALPALPVAPKKLTIPLSLHRLTKLTGGALIQGRKHELLVDRFLSLPFDLVDTSIYVRPEKVVRGQLNEKDRALLSTSSLTNSNQSNARLQPTREQLMKQGYSNWARKPEYTANANFFDKGKQQDSLVDMRKQQLEEIERRRREAAKVDQRQSQIDRIEQTFVDSESTPVHPRKKHLKAVSILPILPSSALHEPEQTKVENTWFEFTDSMLPPPTSDSTTPTPSQSSSTIVLRQGDARSLYLRSDEAESSHETFTFKGDYVLLPTAPVDLDNNFYFMITDDQVFYARYNSRQRLGKRMRQRMELEKELMEQRPAAVEIEFVDNLEERQTKEEDESNEDSRSSKRRRSSDEDEEEEQDAEDEEVDE